MSLSLSDATIQEFCYKKESERSEEASGDETDIRCSAIDDIWCDLAVNLGRSVASLQSRIMNTNTRRALETIDFDTEHAKLYNDAEHLLAEQKVREKFGEDEFDNIQLRFGIASRGAISGLYAHLKERAASLDKEKRPESRKRPRETKSTSFTVKIGPSHSSRHPLPRSSTDPVAMTDHGDRERPAKLRRTDGRWITEDPKTGELCVHIDTR